MYEPESGVSEFNHFFFQEAHYTLRRRLLCTGKYRSVDLFQSRLIFTANCVFIPIFQDKVSLPEQAKTP